MKNKLKTFLSVLIASGLLATTAPVFSADKKERGFKVPEFQIEEMAYSIPTHNDGEVSGHINKSTSDRNNDGTEDIVLMEWTGWDTVRQPSTSIPVWSTCPMPQISISGTGSCSPI